MGPRRQPVRASAALDDPGRWASEGRAGGRPPVAAGAVFGAETATVPVSGPTSLAAAPERNDEAQL